MPTPAHAPTPVRRRTRLLFSAVAIAAVAAAGYFGYRTWSRAAERRDAIAQAQSGPADKALPALLRCLERDPDDPELLKATVETMTKAGAAVPDVEPYVARWCRAAPDDPRAFRARLDVLRRLTLYPEAAEAGERVLELDPADDYSRADVAALYLTLGRYADAAREYRRLLPFPSARADVPLGLARAEWELGHDAEAARLTDGVLGRSPNDPGALILRGMIHHRAGEYEQAVSVLRRVKPATAAEREIVLSNLGLALARLGRADESKKAFAELAAVQNAVRFATDAGQRPDDMPLQVRSAEAWLAAGQPESARNTLEAALSRLGPDRGALTVLAACYEALGRPDLAAKARSDAGRLP